MHGHRIQVWWLDRWASVGMHGQHRVYAGDGRQILAFLDRHEVEVLPVVKVQIDQPTPAALDSSRWGAWLLAEGDRATLMVNDGNLYVGVVPGSEATPGEIELRDPSGTTYVEKANTIVSRELAFAGLRAWLVGKHYSVPGLEWDLYRHRGQ